MAGKQFGRQIDSVQPAVRHKMVKQSMEYYQLLEEYTKIYIK